LILKSPGGVVLGQQPAILEDQIHEPGEEERVVFFLQAESIVIDPRRVGMNGRIIELHLLVGPDLSLNPVAVNRA
jgi:hypothetical protein